MEINQEEKNFEVLGHRVRFKSDDGQSLFAEEAVSRLNKEVNGFLRASPQMGTERALLLSALKLSLELTALEKEYHHDLEKYQRSAEECLRLIEDITPKTH